MIPGAVGLEISCIAGCSMRHVRLNLRHLCMFVACVSVSLWATSSAVKQEGLNETARALAVVASAHYGLLLAGPVLLVQRIRHRGHANVFLGEWIWTFQALSWFMAMWLSWVNMDSTAAILFWLSGLATVVTIVALPFRLAAWLCSAPWQHWVGLVTSLYHFVAVVLSVLISLSTCPL